MGYKRDCKIYSETWYSPAYESVLYFRQNTSYQLSHCTCTYTFCIELWLQYEFEWNHNQQAGKQNLKNQQHSQQHWHIVGAIFSHFKHVFEDASVFQES